MQKLKLPKFDAFEDAYDEKDDSVESVDYFNDFKAHIDDEHDYLYGYITPTCYYDNVIVATDDFYIKKRSKTNLERTYKKVINQLLKRYKEWVNNLYVKEEDNDRS